VSELKPCSHCGGDAKIDRNGAVYCVKCGVQTAIHMFGKLKAIQVWNSRPTVQSYGVPSMEELEGLLSGKCISDTAAHFAARHVHAHLLTQGVDLLSGSGQGVEPFLVSIVNKLVVKVGCL